MPCCNQCLTDVAQRVEVISNNSRALVCGACAVAMTDVNPRAEIRAFVPKAISMFVASDNWYNRDPKLVDRRQRELDAVARRYAERVITYVARRAAAAKAAA